MRGPVVLPAAEQDMADAALWYESRSTGLGAEFLGSVNDSLSEIQRMPESFPVVHLTARRALMRSFPCAVYFVIGAEAVHVIACMHVRREPRRWQGRANK